MKLLNPRDMYGFKSLEVGESREVVGRTREQAWNSLACYNRRKSHLVVHRDFKCTETADGVRVERVR